PRPSLSFLCFVQQWESFSCFSDGNQGDVIVLRKRTGKVAHILDDFLYNRLRAIVRSRADGLDHAIQAKLVSFSVERFGDTVGVENQAIIALERYREVNCKPIK